MIDLPKILAVHALWLKNGPAGVRANLCDADLCNADLSHANLSGAYLVGASLDGANLRGASLDGADLRGASLDGADLRDADLRGASLRDAYLDGANLRGASLDGADLRDADLRGAKLPTHTVGGGRIATFCLSYWALTTPDNKGQRWLRYGCETRTLYDWDRLAGDLAMEHHPTEADRYEAETRALVALCRTLDIGVAS